MADKIDLKNISFRFRSIESVEKIDLSTLKITYLPEPYETLEPADRNRVDYKSYGFKLEEKYISYSNPYKDAEENAKFTVPVNVTINNDLKNMNDYIKTVDSLKRVTTLDNAIKLGDCAIINSYIRSTDKKVKALVICNDIKYDYHEAVSGSSEEYWTFNTSTWNTLYVDGDIDDEFAIVKSKIKVD
jgi:hypothetical protein